MYKRWVPGFTVIELLIVIVVIGILASLGVVAYNALQRSAADRTAQSDLTLATNEMEFAAQHNDSTYPATLPSSIISSPNITLTLKKSGTINYYKIVSAVQNGVLLSQICQDLVDEGEGTAVNAQGASNDYISGCGNWNRNSMQVNGWNPKVFYTPVSDTALLNYADNFTTNDPYNQIQPTVVKNFFHQLVDRLVLQGGYFPSTSFWDSWATVQNGGVFMQPLGTPILMPYYCIEATHTKYADLKWHVTQAAKLKLYSC